jgi:glyoxylase-like metal-dependent hydrolase (beta-lactamase superfamily II)
MKLSYRAAAAAALLAAWASTAAAAPDPAVSPAPVIAQHVVAQSFGVYSLRVGEVQVTALSDGSVPQDLHQLLHRTTDKHTDALLARNYQVNPVEASLNAFLITLPGRLVLVDTGAGQIFGPGYGGKLLESLAQAGVRPEQITDVLITHLHDDHSGGLVKDGQRVFVNAVVHVGKPDVDFFFDPSNQAKTGYDKSYFDIAVKTLKPYLDAGKVETFSGTQEVAPGIEASLHPGHTPGSAFYTLTSAGEHLVFIGDIVHVAAVQFPDPTVTIDYDEDQTAAARTREDAFARFARDGDLIAVPHLPFPGVGHVRAEGHGYAWVPVTYANRAGK